MIQTSELLDRQYQSFITEERDWNFFLGLAHYTKFINETSDFKKIIAKIKKEKQKQRKLLGLEESEIEAIRELQEIKVKILRIIEKNKISSDEISKGVLNLEQLEDGIVKPNWLKSSRLDKGLKGLVKILHDEKHENLLKNILPAEANEHIINIEYGFYDLSPKLSLRHEISDKLIAKGEKEIWGAFEKLQLVYETIFYPEKTRNENLIKEMQVIKKGLDKEKDEKEDYNMGNIYALSKINNKRYNIPEFKKDNYELYATLVQNHFLKELANDKEITKPTHTERAKKFKISIKDRKLMINGYILSEPHATGNLEFMEYVVKKHKAFDKISKEGLPIFIKTAIKDKSFSKTLTDLGFKGEIRKAFFEKISKDSLYYKGNEITLKDIEESGVNFNLFQKELELANLRKTKGYRSE